jgi:PKD repeat protein
MATERATPGTENSNGAPIMNFSAEWKTTVGQPLLLDASDTFDPENDLITFSWDISGVLFTGPQITYQATAVGNVSGTVIAADGLNTTTTSFQIVVIEAGAVPALGTSGTLSATGEQPKCSSLQLVELLPNPNGADTAEFLVIQNPGNETASLAGCRLQVNGSRQYQLSGLVRPHNELLLTKQRFRLPNAASLLELLSTDGTLLDRVQYPKSQEGRSWSRLGNDWGWARPTPNGKNVAFDPVESSVLGASTTQKEVTKIRVQGQVIAQTGLVGSRYAVVLARDGLWLARTAENISLPLFSSVALIGKQTTYQGQRTIAVEGKPVIGKEAAVKATSAKLGDLDEQDAFRLVSVTGTVQMVRGSSIDLEDDTGQGTITIKTASHIIRPTLRAGDQLTATGVVMAGVTGLRILPRQKSDLKIVERVQPTTSPVVQVAPVAENAVLWYWVAGGIGLGSIALWKLWQQHKQRGS